MDNTEQIVKEILDLPNLVDVTKETLLNIGEVIPGGVGSIFTSYKMFKFNKRLKFVESELKDIKELINDKENSSFYKQEVFPLILNYIYHDDQDDKTKIYINGLEYTIKEGFTEIEIIFHYYDVLSELRISDIFYLSKTYGPRDYNKIDIPSLKRLMEDEEYREKYYEEKDIQSYMNNKLIRLGIVEVKLDDPLKRINDSIKRNTHGLSVEKNKVEHYLTPFGKRFLKFFSTQF